MAAIAGEHLLEFAHRCLLILWLRSIALWTTGKKKPVFTQALAHGLHETQSSTEGTILTPRWVTALACLRYGDLLASGSYSNEIRLWKIGSFGPGTSKQATTNNKKSHSLGLSLVGVLPAPGIVNSLQVLSVPRSATDGWSWLSSKMKAQKDSGVERPATSASVNLTRTESGESIVVVAGLGKEPRLGRWLSLKGEGTTNGSRTYVLHQKKGVL